MKILGTQSSICFQINIPFAFVHGRKIFFHSMLGQSDRIPWFKATYAGNYNVIILGLAGLRWRGRFIGWRWRTAGSINPDGAGRLVNRDWGIDRPFLRNSIILQGRIIGNILINERFKIWCFILFRGDFFLSRSIQAGFLARFSLALKRETKSQGTT